MALFAVNRKQNNKGSGVRSGVWKFVEFMFADSIMGEATVEYDCHWFEGELRCDRVRCTKITIFDDDGNRVNPSQSDLKTCAKMAEQAFRNQYEDVCDWEMGII